MQPGDPRLGDGLEEEVQALSLDELAAVHGEKSVRREPVATTGLAAVNALPEGPEPVEIDPVGNGGHLCGIDASLHEFLPEETGQGEKVVGPLQVTAASGEGQTEEDLQREALDGSAVLPEIRTGEFSAGLRPQDHGNPRPPSPGRRRNPQGTHAAYKEEGGPGRMGGEVPEEGAGEPPLPRPSRSRGADPEDGNAVVELFVRRVGVRLPGVNPDLPAARTQVRRQLLGMSLSPANDGIISVREQGDCLGCVGSQSDTTTAISGGHPLRERLWERAGIQ